MGMFDTVMFENGFTTDKEIPDEVLTNDWGQTKQLFCTLDVYMFRENNGNLALYRMNPPLYKVTDEGNQGSIDEKPIDDIEEYADNWIPLFNGTGYIRVGMEKNLKDENYDYRYEFYVTIDNGVVDEIVPYSKTRFPIRLNDYEDDDEYLMNEDKVEDILEEKEPVVQ